MLVNTMLVYNFTWYDINSDQIVKSPRKATLDAIAIAKGTPMQETAEEVDFTALDGNGFLSQS